MSYRSGAIGSLGPIPGVASSRGSDGGGLSATNLASPGLRVLMRLIFSFSFSSCVLLSGSGFEVTSFLCTTKWFSVPGENLLCNDINALT